MTSEHLRGLANVTAWSRYAAGRVPGTMIAFSLNASAGEVPGSPCPVSSRCVLCCLTPAPYQFIGMTACRMGRGHGQRGSFGVLWPLVEDDVRAVEVWRHRLVLDYVD